MNYRNGTAYRWAAEPEVRSKIESIRRRTLTRRAVSAIRNLINRNSTRSKEMPRRRLLGKNRASSECVAIVGLIKQ
jgi:hypothetical protein